jgi:hypothetical protein
MPAIQLYQYFVVDIDESQVQGGSLSRAKSIALGDGEVSDQTFKVAANGGIVKIWDKTENEAMGDFDFLWLETDLDVLVQFTTDAGGDDEYFVVELKGSGVANQMGPALVLGSDVSHQFDGTVDAFDGTEDTIDEIWIYNADASNIARARLVVAT